MPHTIDAKPLTRLCRDIFAACGAPADIAAIVAESLVTTNLFGHDSHGVLRVKQYVDMIRAGMIQPSERPQVVKRFGATAMVSAGYGFGQVAARFAAELAHELGAEHGIGAVSLGQTTHVGRLGEYTAIIAARGLIGIGFHQRHDVQRLGDSLWRTRASLRHKSDVLRCAMPRRRVAAAGLRHGGRRARQGRAGAGEKASPPPAA